MRLEPPVRATPILFLHLAGQLQFSSAGAGFEPASLSHACDLILAARRSCRSVFDAAPLRLFVRLGSPNPPCHRLRIGGVVGDSLATLFMRLLPSTSRATPIDLRFRVRASPVSNDASCRCFNDRPRSGANLSAGYVTFVNLVASYRS